MQKRLNIFNAKRKLYSRLLELNNDEFTDDDIIMMESLAKDKEIQAYLDDVLTAKRNKEI